MTPIRRHINCKCINCDMVESEMGKEGESMKYLEANEIPQDETQEWFHNLCPLWWRMLKRRENVKIRNNNCL